MFCICELIRSLSVQSSADAELAAAGDGAHSESKHPQSAHAAMHDHSEYGDSDHEREREREDAYEVSMAIADSTRLRDDIQHGDDSDIDGEDRSRVVDCDSGEASFLID